MELKQRFQFTPPSPYKFDRVINWCERQVKNFYELSSEQLPYRPLQQKESRNRRYQVSWNSGVITNATVDSDSIYSNMQKLQRSFLVGTLYSAHSEGTI